MIEFLQKPPEERKLFIDQASTRAGMSAVAMEKDWWVTLVLRALFSLPMASHFIFKGGTSLSKGWKLINRFSEDIDIALAPDAFDEEYKLEPSRGFVKKLKRKGCAYTSTTIKDALEEKLLEMGMPEGMLLITAEAVKEDMPDKDPQTIFVRFPSFYEPNPYILPDVKIEFSVRSLKNPFTDVAIQSILSETLADTGYAEDKFTVQAVEPRKTFLEKVFLLHEKFLLVTGEEMIGDRQSRHFSDLVSMMDTDVETAVWNDPVFFSVLLHHREKYVGHREINYQKMQMAELRFVPPDNMLDLFRIDYNIMLEEMIYGDHPPDFDLLIQKLRLLNGRFFLAGDTKKLNELIESAIENFHELELIQDDPQAQITLTDDQEKSFTLHFDIVNRQPVFNRIE